MDSAFSNVLPPIITFLLDKPTSELAEIVDPYYIEVSSEEAAEKLKSSGITFEMKESEGHYILRSYVRME